MFACTHTTLDESHTYTLYAPAPLPECPDLFALVILKIQHSALTSNTIAMNSCMA